MVTRSDTPASCLAFDTRICLNLMYITIMMDLGTDNFWPKKSPHGYSLASPVWASPRVGSLLCYKLTWGRGGGITTNLIFYLMSRKVSRRVNR